MTFKEFAPNFDAFKKLINDYNPTSPIVTTTDSEYFNLLFNYFGTREFKDDDKNRISALTRTI